eukprot:CAMPEP_0113934008 /NCGR_PEP_ID=MMETSP1339-20121228/1352_1 /TAXON_ID=94617 /ORGANISM="Fibrocapsa japonica" /LENGTH=169 /DNA_ID=CAMNT_0000935611 /DNA_START=99 /DNA_END=608 /DNA_ORIENTATION=+ /assembly_acc=CAM_ASM_000762
MGSFHDTLCGPCAKNARKTITYTWFTSLAFVAIAFIIACVATSRISAEGDNRALGFAAIWTVLLMVALGIGGSIVMKKFQTSLAIGFFLGVVIMMSQQCLILFAIFAGRAGATDSESESSADKGMASFCFLLFLIYGFFASVLGYFRKDLIKEADAMTADESQMPPQGM